jgi:predicted negative regulator of RcsB-dependent stress response
MQNWQQKIEDARHKALTVLSTVPASSLQAMQDLNGRLLAEGASIDEARAAWQNQEAL